MELRDYIEKGILLKGSVQQLADFLGVIPTNLTAAKAHRRGISNVAAVKLARLVGADPIAVIAASELATERQEDKRAFWFPFVKHTEIGKTAGYALILATVTNFATPSPAEAAPALALAAPPICIM